MVRVAEQGLTVGLSAADRACVLDHGRVVLSGTAAVLAGDRRAVDTYPGRWSRIPTGRRREDSSQTHAASQRPRTAGGRREGLLDAPLPPVQ